MYSAMGTIVIAALVGLGVGSDVGSDDGSAVGSAVGIDVGEDAPTFSEAVSVRRGRRWKDLGFQGEDPATDVRGGGLLLAAP